jgi:Fe-S-cluster-containing hydrogenase component 2
MENVPIHDGEIDRHLPYHLRKFLKEKELYFFKIRYADSEIIMPRGSFSDFAGLHLQGVVRVYAGDFQQTAHHDQPQECWRQAGWPVHRLEQWILERTDRLAQLGEEWHRPRWLRWLQPIELHVARWLRTRLTALARPSLRRRWHEQRLGAPIPLGSASQHVDHGFITALSTTDASGQELPVFERFMGITSALWNLPRSVTLVATSDGQGKPCEFLLVKREVLKEISEKSPEVEQLVTRKFLEQQLPQILAENRLFRDTFSPDDVTDWPRFLEVLRGDVKPPSIAVAQILQGLSPEFHGWLASADDRTNPLAEPIPQRVKYRALGALNGVLKRRNLYDPGAWPERLSEEARELLERQAMKLPSEKNERARLNHILVETAFGPEIIRPSTPCTPLRVEDFAALLQPLVAQGPLAGIELKHYAKHEEISSQGTPSIGLLLIVSGKVRVTKKPETVEEAILVNQLERNGYLGVSCIEPGATHAATVTAYTDVVHLVVFTGAALEALLKKPFVSTKLKNERERLLLRDQLIEGVDRMPPADPPEEIAPKLLAATNLLRIDMDLCTRCDQCVAGCSAAHDGVSRFHRANPSLRFGKWEIAKACVHCSDAPCQTACPVGAITFLDDGLVQLHRSRCIGCEKCIPACPFDVIEMTPPRFKEVAFQGLAIVDMAPNNTKGLIANKCDLCLTVNRDPPCVASCPYGAATRGAPRELFPAIKNWAELFAVR